MFHMDKLTVFGGKGYVGSRYVDLYSDCVVKDRNDYVPDTNNILYFISTIDNYNVFTDLHLDIETNLNTLMTVFENIKDKESTVFNFISSWFVYGSTDYPATETSYCNPNGFYSITKRAAEQLLISYCQTFGMKYRILRLSNVVGGNDPKVSRKKNAFEYMLRQVKNNEELKLYEGGDVYRDYIHVDDCARAINTVITKGKLNSIYNISNGVPIKLLDVIDFAKKITNSSSPVVGIETPHFHNVVQVKSMYLDNTKLKELGYAPVYTIEDIITEVINKPI